VLGRSDFNVSVVRGGAVLHGSVMASGVGGLSDCGGRKREEANLAEDGSGVGDQRTDGAAENKAVEAIGCLTHRRNRANALWRSGRCSSVRLSLSAARRERGGHETHPGN